MDPNTEAANLLTMLPHRVTKEVQQNASEGPFEGVRKKARLTLCDDTIVDHDQSGSGVAPSQVSTDFTGEVLEAWNKKKHVKEQPDAFPTVSHANNDLQQASFTRPLSTRASQAQRSVAGVVEETRLSSYGDKELSSRQESRFGTVIDSEESGIFSDAEEDII